MMESLTKRQIHYLTRSDLNVNQWDSLVRDSANGRAYALSFYLDTMTGGNWNAVVLGDYEAILPLPFRKKWGLKLIANPAFSQQLGIIWSRPVAPAMQQKMLQAIPAGFLKITLGMNAANELEDKVVMRNNFVLSLLPDAPALERGYSRSARRNIHKANEAGLRIKEGITSTDLMILHRLRYRDLIGVAKVDYERFQELMDQLLDRGMGYTVGVMDKEGHLLAASFYIRFKDRLTFIFNGNDQESLKNGATHYLKNFVIRKFAGKGIIMDFEGSDTPDFARFYRQYGAHNEPYPRWEAGPLSVLRRLFN